MRIIFIAITVIMLGGLGALLSRGSPKLATSFGVRGSVVGAVIGLIGAIWALLSPLPAEAIRLPWSVPYGSFYIEADALSAFFLLPIFLLTGLAAVYGSRYLSGPQYLTRLGSHWFFFNTLAASMVMVIVARNAVLFLIAWEVMALASFFLVTMENERESVQRAGWTYLVATHLGTMALFFLFILMGSKAGSLDFDQIAAAGIQFHPQASLFFVLALIGFGTKAGIVPLHVWLPEAHPAAPSHVSAVMSGVMIKTGIYGMIRTLTWLGTPHMSWVAVLSPSVSSPASSAC
jgi:hydrogenase-4 component B